MPAGTLRGHYDGKRIMVDEPFEIPPNSPVIVTILPVPETVLGEDWVAVASRALAAAYDADEPDYGVDDLQPR